MNAPPPKKKKKKKKSSLPRQPNHRRIGMITPNFQKNNNYLTNEPEIL